MHLPEIDKYAYLDSLIQTWDVRLKIIFLSFLIIIISFLPNIPLSLIGFTLAYFIFFLSRLPLSFLLKQLRWLMLFILFFLVFLPLTVKGKVLLKLGFLTVSQQGLNLGLLISLRALSIFILLVVMLGTSSFSITLKALESLGVPNKLVQMIMFTYRYIFLFWEELRRVSLSASSRLFKRKTNLYTLRITANLVGLLFIRGLEKTEKVYQAMVSRGYQGKIKTLKDFQFKKSDFLKAGLVFLGGLFLIILSFVL